MNERPIACASGMRTTPSKNRIAMAAPSTPRATWTSSKRRSGHRACRPQAGASNASPTTLRQKIAAKAPRLSDAAFSTPSITL